MVTIKKNLSPFLSFIAMLLALSIWLFFHDCADLQIKRNGIVKKDNANSDSEKLD